MARRWLPWIPLAGVRATGMLADLRAGHDAVGLGYLDLPTRSKSPSDLGSVERVLLRGGKVEHVRPPSLAAPPVPVFDPSNAQRLTAGRARFPAAERGES